MTKIRNDIGVVKQNGWFCTYCLYKLLWLLCCAQTSDIIIYIFSIACVLVRYGTENLEQILPQESEMSCMRKLKLGLLIDDL